LLVMGLVGHAALRHFGASGGCEVIALSRRKPRERCKMIATEDMFRKCFRQARQSRLLP
jgi:hypothetical protein